jgi:lipoyl-dependent peroxiredoxin subunit C
MLRCDSAVGATRCNQEIIMLTVGDTFPAFKLAAVKGGKEGLDLKSAFTEISSESDAGKWKLVFFWPKDFTFVCPTEIVAFGKLAGEFADRDTVVYGVSTDSEFVHLNWRLHHDDLRDLPIPMLADIKRELSQELGILDKAEGVCLRATFIVDPEGIIRFVSVNDLSVGRNPQEVLRVLDALQADELCPCNWQKGDDVLKAA